MFAVCDVHTCAISDRFFIQTLIRQSLKHLIKLLFSLCFLFETYLGKGWLSLCSVCVLVQTLAMIEQTEKEAMKEGQQHIRKKTHKGEVEVEDEDMSTLVVSLYFA